MTGVYHIVPNTICTDILAEFDFRYSNRIALGVDDGTRAFIALKGAAGKRLRYQRPD